MDESWRMRMGMPGLPRRRSTEDSSRRSVFSGTGTLETDDFSDVFGGPPRSVLSWRFSGGYENKQSNSSFYEEILRTPEFVCPPTKIGKSWPAFRIPAKEEGFYSDIFRSNDEKKSRERSGRNSKTKSKSNSSSVQSSEEVSPLRPVIGDDVALSSFASKLRPINVPCRWNSSKTMPQEHQKQQGMPVSTWNCSAYTDYQYMEANEYKENFNSPTYGYQQPVPSPETISLEPDSYQSIKLSVDDLELNSTSSAVSSLCHDPEANKPGSMSGDVLEEDEDDEVMSSYVIEITASVHREGTTSEAVAVDEAIAWAKEKFQRNDPIGVNMNTRERENEQCIAVEGRPDTYENADKQVFGKEMIQSPEERKPRNLTAEEGNQHSENDTEMDGLDDDIRLWSAGKETNIRLLLSTLHHILWQNSGWYAIPLSSLIGSSQVKKAYQKARLCLHPDKLQQRGATVPQKYVAEKAFSILQGAWTEFISKDVFIDL